MGYVAPSITWVRTPLSMDRWPSCAPPSITLRKVYEDTRPLSRDQEMMEGGNEDEKEEDAAAVETAEHDDANELAAADEVALAVEAKDKM
ncbi:hypothetical protein LTR36_001606 [Oleoguttula mirabilis]|uniref:Uncharacterized protein n=1 Tax=Oleoguttula mirabilis TaxID=1507867 RepID=A0AAV9JND6_9PEZI|nr:hypothetical protein LTR36_001606 [Oleoguttula mirabilis]